MKTLPVSVLLGLLGWLSIGIAILLFGYIVAEAVLTGEVALSSRIRGSTVVPRTELPRMFWGIVAFCAVSGIGLGWLGIYLIKGARSVKRWSTYHYVRLTRRSSGLAYGKPLTFNVRPHVHTFHRGPSP